MSQPPAAAAATAHALRLAGDPRIRAVLFFAAYLLLSRVSFLYPMGGSNITPWNPQAALAVGFLVLQPAAWPVVWIAAACAEAWTGSEPVRLTALVASTGALAAGYAVTAVALRRWVGTAPDAIGRRSAVVFLGVAAAGALISSSLRMGALWAVGVLPFARLPAAVHRASIGDSVGFIVTLPVLFVLASPKHRMLTQAMLRSAEGWLIAVLTVLGVVAVFQQAPADQFKFFYVLFVPVVWAALRFGVTGSIWSAALVQGLLIAAVEAGTYQPLTVFELQVLMASLSSVGILLGAIVDERVAAEEALRASLRLAAAGDMAAALAHELNQPLTAISTYARAAQVLAGRLQGAGAEGQSLADVSGKLAAEAARAGEVVNRLRRFFRERATELQPTDFSGLLREALHSQAQRARELQVRLLEPEDGELPLVWVDRIQMAVVLRNLLANAIEAASDPRLPPDAERSVRVRAEQLEGELVVTVLDSGRGLDAEQVRTVFDARASGKPGGMGIGLAISRTIVEAHGGRLWAHPGPGGTFRLALPLGAENTA
jgi:signal transduction histidine kinase